MPKESVTCSWCGNGQLKRWPINPVTKKPIKNFFCDTKCKGAWQQNQREQLGFTREWLKSQYVDQGKSANQIGKEIGRDGKRVWEWIKQYGMETRPRGHNHEENLAKDGSPFKGRSHSQETKAMLREMAKADGRLPWGKNNKHPWKGVTGKGHPSFRGGLTPERQAFYSSPEWVEAVKEVWARDDATCQRCGKHHNQTKNRGTFHIHHIVSFQVRALRAEVSNLLLLCRECHLWVHSKENTENQFIGEHHD